MAKPKARRLEAIAWRDHCSYSASGWKSLGDINELAPMTIITVGFVVKETPDHVNLCCSIDAKDYVFAGDFCIIKSTIVKRWRLKSPIA